ncbi:hypothetical protein D3C85_1771940 [compost metagenome]
MQTTQHPARGARVIVLNKTHRMADGILETLLIEAFIEEPAVITKHLGFEQHEPGNIKASRFHQ